MIARFLVSACLLTAVATAETELPARPNGENGGELKTPLLLVEEAAQGDAALTALPQELWDAYFEKPPSAFLVDPQGMLSPADFRERVAFLDYHAGDSRIDLYVYVLAGDQEMPAVVRDGELMARLFQEERPQAMVYYFFGKPMRSALLLSPSLAARIPENERWRALENPLIQATKESDPARQFETFLVQMSIRLYWLETLLGEEVGPSTTDGPAKLPAVQKPSDTAISSAIGPWIEHLLPRLLPAFGMVGGGLMLALILWCSRRRMRHGFLDLDVEPRLGGMHAAGVGAVISFSNATEPPAAQRRQIPGYLRRMR